MSEAIDPLRDLFRIEEEPERVYDGIFDWADFRAACEQLQTTGMAILGQAHSGKGPKVQIDVGSIEREWLERKAKQAEELARRSVRGLHADPDSEEYAAAAESWDGRHSLFERGMRRVIRVPLEDLERQQAETERDARARREAADRPLQQTERRLAMRQPEGVNDLTGRGVMRVIIDDLGDQDQDRYAFGHLDAVAFLEVPDKQRTAAEQKKRAKQLAISRGYKYGPPRSPNARRRW